MRAALLTLLLLASLGASVARAQDEDAGAQRTRTRVIRPPEGSLRRGVIPSPDWAVYVGGGLIVAAAAGALAYRVGKKRR